MNALFRGTPHYRSRNKSDLVGFHCRHLGHPINEIDQDFAPLSFAESPTRAGRQCLSVMSTQHCSTVICRVANMRGVAQSVEHEFIAP